MKHLKRPYAAPRLTVHGSIASVTRAVSRLGFLDATYPGGVSCDIASRSGPGACPES